MSVIEHNAYRMAWGLLSLAQKQSIYKALEGMECGKFAAMVIIADMREERPTN